MKNHEFRPSRVTQDGAVVGMLIYEHSTNLATGERILHYNPSFKAELAGFVFDDPEETKNVVSWLRRRLAQLQSEGAMFSARLASRARLAKSGQAKGDSMGKFSANPVCYIDYRYDREMAKLDSMNPALFRVHSLNDDLRDKISRGWEKIVWNDEDDVVSIVEEYDEV